LFWGFLLIIINGNCLLISHLTIFKVTLNRATAYLFENKYTKSIEQCLLGIKILQGDSLPYTKDLLSGLYFCMGRAYKALGKHDPALENFKKSLDLRKSILGSKHPKIENVYAEMAIVYSEKKEYELALKFFQKALISNILDFNDNSFYVHPPLDDYLDGDALFGSLRDKGNTFYKLYKQKSGSKDLESALICFQLCDQLINKRLKSSLNLSDKIFLEQFAKEVYHNGIKVSLELFSVTNNVKYRELSFYFSQKSKANVLLEAINSKSGKQQNLLPDNLKQLEDDLNVDISYYQSLRLQALAKESKIDSVKVNEYDDKLFNLNRKLDSLAQSLEKTYPKYYDIKYNYETQSLTEVQSKLKKQEALLEYFSTDDGTYAFAVSKDTIIIEELPAITEDQISTLQHSLKPEFFLKNQQKAFDAYTQVAHKLYQDQVGPLLSNFQGIKKLYVIPNGHLHQVPFELLLFRKPDSDQKQQYSELPYLIKHYNISYAYSVTLLFKENLLPDLKRKSMVLAFAPNYPEQVKDTVDLQILGKFRDEVTPLKWNQAELQSINQYFEGEFLHSEMATEKMFNERINDYDIVHLAMHALVDDEDPMNSKLVFSHATDSLNDSYLHSFEIYSKHINTQLAVLSACNTGSGELHSGEGLMSLARAFQYAGCPSVVMSHWRVDDKSSSIIMGEFYRYLAEGKNKDEALRMAKLNYLDQASPLGQHPFYWNSFVVMGNIKPIAQDENHKIWHWTFGGIGLIFLLVLGTAAYAKRKQ
ncbi:CHAT domain-containing tetratricopeptide repeat protein, partial [Fulvivirga kasyanovii]